MTIVFDACNLLVLRLLCSELPGIYSINTGPKTPGIKPSPPKHDNIDP